MVSSCKSMATISSLTSAKMRAASLGVKSGGKFLSLSTLGSSGCECRVCGWEMANDVGESKLGAEGTELPPMGFINEPLANRTLASENIGDMLMLRKCG